MNNTITKIIGTSFLNPSNKTWKKLSEGYRIEFGNYGNCVNEILNTPKEQGLCMIHFYLDTINLENKTYNQIINEYKDLFEIIHKRLEISKSTFIYAYSFYNNINCIKKARTLSIVQKLMYWFYTEIEKIFDIYPNFYVINLDDEFSKIGFEKIYDNRNWYFAHCRLTNVAFQILTNSIHSILNRIYMPSSKVLVLDCDNTLWGGVIGEDGLEGITLGQDGLGQLFLDFQKKIKKLQEEGLILALCSKNNEEDVFEVLDKHHFMLLRRNDIVSFKINWLEKSINISEIAKELNVGLESIVFCDDNPIEREKVKNTFPQIKVIELKDDIFNWPNIIEEFDSLSRFEITDEDKKKTIQYSNRAEFERDYSVNREDPIEYLKSIDLKPALFKLNSSNISRAEQLCLKTNQFNMRTVRHTRSDLLNFSSQNDEFCFLISLKDKYGDHGIVGLICLEEINSKYIFIETFLLSCRVLGRHLESWIIKEVNDISLKFGYQYIIGEFIPTVKNVVAKDIYLNTSFLEITKDELFDDLNDDFFSKTGILYKMPVNSVKIPLIEIYE